MKGCRVEPQGPRIFHLTLGHPGERSGQIISFGRAPKICFTHLGVGELVDLQIGKPIKKSDFSVAHIRNVFG